MIRYKGRTYRPEDLPTDIKELQAHALSWPKDRDTYLRAGAREVVPFVPPEGYVPIAGTLTEVDNGEQIIQTYEVRTVEEQAAIDAVQQESEQAAIQAAHDAFVAAVAPSAIVFANTLRTYFPDLDPPAEQNAAVTEDAIKQHFIGQRFAGTMTLDMLADSMLLNSLFQTLKQSDGTVWSLPWSDIWATQV